MKYSFKENMAVWSKRSFRLNAYLSIAFLVAGLVVNYFANIYTVVRASNYVTDIILDNIPVFNVDFFFYEGFSIFLIGATLFLLLKPKNIPFTVKSIALFIIIRSVFISLTHLSPPPWHSYLEHSDFFSKMTSGYDMFFSSHTGLPFLFALIFWRNKLYRNIFIMVSAFFGAIVLLGHLHYSIDVFAAFFITYGIFHICRQFFAKDFETLKNV